MRDIQRSTLLLICLTFFGIQAVYSCSCIKRTLEGQIAATGFVFVGKVVEIKEDTSKKRQLYESRKYIVKLKVIENFKGAKNAEINLVQYEIKGRTSCPNWNLVVDETYLIFANGFGQNIKHQVACLPTQRFDSESSTYTELLKYKAKIKKKK